MPQPPAKLAAKKRKTPELVPGTLEVTNDGVNVLITLPNGTQFGLPALSAARFAFVINEHAKELITRQEAAKPKIILPR